MGLLPPDERRAFGAHSRHCPNCGRVSAQAHEFVGDLKRAVNTPKGPEYADARTAAARRSIACECWDGNELALQRLRKELSQLDAAIVELENTARRVQGSSTGKLLVMPARP
jgi:hypothetical protein